MGAIVLVGVVIASVAMRIETERMRHSGNWPLIVQLVLLDVVVGVALSLYMLCRFLRPTLIHSMSESLLIAIAVQAVVAVGIRTYARRMNHLDSQISWDLILTFGILLSLSSLNDMLGALNRAGGQ
ncbi:hypothetical protein [Burkholderia ubonensis]|uniref:hypothetical protein n=1 Tax=Burkholderia ubonensis TaxID=101571 RepID=UPI000752840C|nr:hypothetical protein [Burkholderia ubonensis]KWB79024.1 hypothetical protein WL42_13470 [Burkholderia ubonensis]